MKEYRVKGFDMMFDLRCWALPLYFFWTSNLIHIQILCVGFNYWISWKKRSNHP